MSAQKGRPVTRFCLSLVCVLGLGCTARGSARLVPQKGGGIPLFDGKTLAGWEGNPAFFRVKEGAIVAGRRDVPIPRNEFLCTTEEFGDFILRLQFKLDKGVNSGVQIRSQRVPGSHEVIGYQADLGDGWWGALYDESRRNRLLARPDFSRVERILDREGWNHYEIVANGRRIRLFINGHPTIEYMEPETALEQKGRTCLQIHSGPPGEVWFRELELEELPPASGRMLLGHPRPGGRGHMRTWALSHEGAR